MAGSCGAERGLGVLPDAGSGCRIASVPDRNMAVQGVKGRLGEHLGNQPHVLVHPDVGAIAHRDTRGLLPAMLKSVEPEVREFGNLLVGGPYAEDTAGILRALLTGEKFVTQPSITAWHGNSLVVFAVCS